VVQKIQRSPGQDSTSAHVRENLIIELERCWFLPLDEGRRVVSAPPPPFTSSLYAKLS